MKYRVEITKENAGISKTQSTSEITSKSVANNIYRWAKSFIGQIVDGEKVVDVKLITE